MNVDNVGDVLANFPVDVQVTLTSLNAMESVVNQLLTLLLSETFTPDMYSILAEPNTFLDTPSIKSFHKLLDVFKSLMNVYNVDLFLTPSDIVPGMWYPDSPVLILLKTHESFIIATIRKANLTVFLLSLIGCLDHDVVKLQNKFLDMFSPNTMFSESMLNVNEQLLRTQWLLYLDMKTQIYIILLQKLRKNNNTYKENADEIDEAEKINILETQIFSKAFANELVLRRTRTSADSTLTTSFERVFVQRYSTRKENLMSFSSLSKLKEEHSEESFIRNIFEYCNKNMSLIIWGTKHRNSKSPIFTTDTRDFDPQLLYATDGDLLINAIPYRANTNQSYINSEMENNVFQTELAVDSPPNSSVIHDGTQSSDQFSSHAATPSIPANTKSIADAVLAVNKKSKSKRTWSTAEEDALVDGLKAFGPSWVKILDFHGPGGKFTEALKNRTQVQLKDKARNWKLQYLKNGTPLPQYLVRVTGSLDKSKSKNKNVENNAPNADPPQNNKQNNFNVPAMGSSSGELFSSTSANETRGFDPNLTPRM